MSPPAPNTPPSATPLTTSPDHDPSPSDLLTSLESASLDPPSLRESRAQALAEQLREARRHKSTLLNDSTYLNSLIEPVTSDDALLRFTTQHPKCLVHFSHPDFARCTTMDGHLRSLGVRHLGSGLGSGQDVRFGEVDVRRAPFVVERLGVRVLPCVVGFVEGVSVGRVVGFEGLGVFRENEGVEGGGAAVTRELERVLVGWGVLGERTGGWGVGCGGGESSGEEDEEEYGGKRVSGKGKGGWLGGQGKGIIQGRKKQATEDDDEDWD